MLNSRPQLSQFLTDLNNFYINRKL